ncbi:hypothetical protein Rsub_06473 [Raphidocelis subcapitata]|uniref:Uncharacterized protein n=1 Tax=Raphidocelis subcapitata TaxID=307507 RepID=A0A2V0P8J1_9CHLO|nr:hypothetical protein Rsub_06473 [Raphidocelis subcapitata]|eukprot:GBF94203.1 hypothetical protein Rsub_06473 [Raphidocelis subcapitata]
MYDYTFSIPHGVVSITSGIIGLLRTGNPVFATPLVCGVVFLAIAVRSLKRFFRGMLSPDGVIVALVMAVGLVYQMNKLLEETGLWWPCGSQRAVRWTE